MASPNRLWSEEERLCFSFLSRVPSPPRHSSLLQIHAFLLRRHLLFPNLHLLTLLLSSSPDLRYSRRLFALRTSHDPFLCNSMLRSLARRRSFHESISLYRQLRSDKQPFSPNAHTFPILLKSSAATGDSKQAVQLHAHVVKMGFCRNPFSATGLVDMYAKLGDVVSARKVFDGTPERNVVSWTAMVNGYVKAGDLGSAVTLFRAMPEKDPAAYNAMIDAFFKFGDLGSARELFDGMPERDRNVVTWTSLMSGYAKVGDMETARVLFDRMPERNNFSWNVMIGGYCKNDLPDRALELFRKLQSGSCLFEPDEVTVVSVIPAIASMGVIDLGRWIHLYARSKGLDRCTNVSTALVDMYFKCGDIQEARQVFESIPEKETASWNSMINGLAVNGRSKEALDVFFEMKRSGACPNEVTMLGVLSACSHGGLVEEGRKWFLAMDALGIGRRVDHYGCMVDLLGRAGHLDEAERLVERMSCGPNGIILSSLLFASACYRDVARAERLMIAAERIEPGNVRNYVIMRNLYAEEERWADVGMTKEAIRRLGGKKEAGCSVIQVGRRAWEFVSGDRVHPEWETIYKLIGDLQLNMKGKEGILK
ncbi:pentatricopeptide repeat-containing protein [Iris pallida]|uniref:Pentatricopeptide repeat-containing protein n=1 Tax=Iris pallida TaxID=29817 RepID=A0AAX6EQK7_IRIPA|nr:pentatricopeptide repeat-containing protein [Iris pallida]